MFRSTEEFLRLTQNDAKLKFAGLTEEILNPTNP